ncbi:unnamed protein product [Hymenolepis diminuta]|uniref:Uncharacterized protein n=1 Tax=Hymenolepis diminuta TaxID=6216 RepID=A0A564YXV5_HYMDI|nr:unnamed protein product [Hymenolepis diminuta]
MGNVVHPGLGLISLVLLHKTQEAGIMHARLFLNKVRHPEEERHRRFSPNENHSTRIFDEVNSEGHTMSPPLLPQGLRFNADAYEEVLQIIDVKPWTDMAAKGGRSCVF